MLARLVDLEPEWIRWEDRPDTWTECVGDPLAWRPGDPTRQVSGMREYVVHVSSLAEAQGIWFNCPVCGRTNTERRSHGLAVAFAGRGVLDHHGSRNADGHPTRWTVSGTSFEDLTLSPSVDLTVGNPGCWHGFVINGDVT